MQRADIPVDGCLVNGIIQSVEEVEEHRCQEFATIFPVDFGPFGFSAGGPILLPGPTASPNAKSQSNGNGKGDPGASRSTDLAKVQAETPHKGANNLGSPIKHVIQRASSGGEVCAIHDVELIRVKGVGAEEEREKEKDPRVAHDSFPEPKELARP